MCRAARNNEIWIVTAEQRLEQVFHCNCNTNFSSERYFHWTQHLSPNWIAFLPLLHSIAPDATKYIWTYLQKYNSTLYISKCSNIYLDLLQQEEIHFIKSPFSCEPDVSSLLHQSLAPIRSEPEPKNIFSFNISKLV